MSEPSPQWVVIEVPLCDVCGAHAKYRHPLGGLRCSTCPRPDVKLFGVFDVVQHRWWPRSFRSFGEAQAHYDQCKGPGSHGEVRALPTEPIVGVLHARREGT
jgi:hypothetical protein